MYARVEKMKKGVSVRWRAASGGTRAHRGDEPVDVFREDMQSVHRSTRVCRCAANHSRKNGSTTHNTHHRHHETSQQTRPPSNKINDRLNKQITKDSRARLTSPGLNRLFSRGA